MSDADRFWSHVDQSGGPEACWPFTGSINPEGYGLFSIDGRTQRAHRVAFTETKGPIGSGLVVDHQCHNESTCTDVPCTHRRCCNPQHLEDVTQSVNSIRGRSGDHQSAKTHCPADHEYTKENTIIKLRKGRPQRSCRECNRGHQARYNATRRAA